MLVFDSFQRHVLFSHHPHVAPLPSLSSEAGQTHASAAPTDIEAEVVDKVPILQGNHRREESQIKTKQTKALGRSLITTDKSEKPQQVTEEKSNKHIAHFIL